MGISGSYFLEKLSFTSLKRVIRGPKKPYGDSKGVVHDPKGSYGGLVGFKGLRKKTQQTVTKDSTKRYKRLNKETQKTQQIAKKRLNKEALYERLTLVLGHFIVISHVK